MGFTGRNGVSSVQYIKDNNHRLFLRMVANAVLKPRVVLVIMKNPSKTCNNLPNSIQNSRVISSYKDKAKCHIDRTTGRLLRKLNSSYDEIIVLNLYSLYTPSPVIVNNYYYLTNKHYKNFQTNNNYIASFLKLYSGDVICAWGGPNGINKNAYDSHLHFINSLFTKQHTLKEYDNIRGLVSRKNNNTYPLHPFAWF